MTALFLRYRKEALILGIGGLNMLAIAIVQHLSHSDRVLLFLDNERWTVENLLIALLTWLGYRQAAAEDRRSRFFFFVAWAAYGVGQLFWDLQVAIGWNPFPAPGDLFYLSLAPLLAAGFLCARRAGLTKGELGGMAVDVSSMAVMALTLTLALYLPEWKGISLLTNVAAILYPVLYLTALGAGVMVVLVGRIRLGAGVVLLLAGLAGFACCWLEWNYRTLRGDPLNGTLVGYGFSVFSLMAGVGASHWRNVFSRSPRHERWSLRLQRLLPLLLVFSACVAVVFGNYHFSRALNVVIDFCAAVMVVLAAARQSMVLHEQDQLLKAEQKLRESEGQLQDLARNSSDVIFGIQVGDDGAFRYQSMNPAGEGIGLKEAVLRGRTSHECFPAETADALESIYRACAVAAAPVARDIPLSTPAGMAWFEVVLVPFRDEMDRVVRINGIARNISARKSILEAAKAHAAELEQRVAERTRELRAINAGKDRLFSIIAHDLKNPMTAVLLASEQLLEAARDSGEAVPPLMTHMAQVVHESASCVSRLLLDLLTWGQIQMGRAQASPAEVDLHALLQSNIELAHITARKKRLILCNRLDRQVSIYGDPQMIDAVVRNLLANAIKFTAPDGRIEAGAYISDDEPQTVIVFVTDSGVGILPEKIGALFQLESNASTRGTSGELGTGLGLPLCREMVELNRGRLWAESSPGQGSTFFFTMPRGGAN